MSQVPVVFDQLKERAAKASLFALEALEQVVRNPEGNDSDKVKAAHQIIVILDKAMDYTELTEKYNELREQLNHISDHSEYDPEA